jgi:GH25 family lysozyme M1 (1,4-beta-N-acetylmuramidase)
MSSIPNGYDISKWQAGLNVSKVAADFTIIKASEGVTIKDGQFETFAANLEKLGRRFGIYHFATGKTSGAREAEWFVSCCGKYVKNAILFLDWEAGAVAKGVRYAKEFLDKVKALTGKTPGIYMNASCLKSYTWESVSKEYPLLWLALYASNDPQVGYNANPWCNVTNFKGFTKAIHQYSSKGRLNGWSGNLDLDKCYISGEEWDAIAGGSPVPPTPPTPPEPYTQKQFIKDVQSAIGVTVDGIAGPKTLAATPTVSKTKNNRHAVVLPMQKYLNSLGFDVGDPDGVAGNKFDAGLKAFQKANGCIVDGEATSGKLTWQTMLGYFPPKSEEKTSTTKTSANATVSTTTTNSDPIYYKVRSRDTMTKIAIQYKTTVKEIMALNPDIKNANTIYPGQRIRIK